MIDKVGETRQNGGMEEMAPQAAKMNNKVSEDSNKLSLAEILAAQPLNPLRQLEFRVLPLYEQKPS